MQNIVQKVIVVFLGIIIVLLAILLLKQSRPTEINLLKQSQPAQIQQEGSNTSVQTVVENNDWKTSVKYGLTYPAGVEFSEGTTGQYSTAVAQFTYDGAIVTWGGGVDTACMTDGNEFGVFNAGTSTVACIKGQTARITAQNASATISQKALNLFGEFVLANQ